MLLYFQVGWFTDATHLTSFLKEADFMARIPDEEIERLKREVSPSNGW